MIEARGLRKTYGSTLAVDDLDFRVEDGRVTGFLGPNGAGKSTTMRIILGLDRPDAGAVRIDGRRFGSHTRPLRDVGALLDAGYIHPTRTAHNHLWALAASNGIRRQRVDEVLELVGLTQVASKRVGSFSLGMKQRLGLAGALLGDPKHLLFDEPANGLDPEGVHWMREFLRDLAARGHSVLVSSHLLSEMSLMAQDLIVIGRGRMIFSGTVDEFVDGSIRSWVNVRSPRIDDLAEALASVGATLRNREGDSIQVEGLDASLIGELAFRKHIPLHELSPRRASLEEAFLQVTQDAQEYRTGERAR